MLLDDMFDLLSSGGATGDGTALYVGMMQEQPANAICVYETGGMGPIRAMRSLPGQPVAEQPRIQVVVRGEQLDYATPRLKMNTLYQLLEGLGDRSINSTRYLWFGAVQSPFMMGKDGDGRPLIAVNFDVVKELSTA